MERIKIFYDCSIFDIQRFGGISRYFSVLIHSLDKKIFKVNFKCLISDNEYLKDRGLVFVKSKLYDVNIKGFKRLSWKLNSYINSLYSYYCFWFIKFDVFHPTYYSVKLLKFFNKGKVVVTIYDMIHEIFPNLFSDSQYVIECKKNYILKSDKIIAISENTKRDILKFYPQINESKIQVIYLASSISDCFAETVEIQFQQYILFVGNRNGYKRFKDFIEGAEQAVKKFKDLNILCVGGGSFNKDEFEHFKNKGIQDKIHQGNFNDRQMKWLYSNALAFVFSSEYEGFGIPILEAFESSCPVILPESSCFPEIAGDAGLFYQLNGTNQISEYISKLLNDIDYRNEIKRSSFERSKHFSWEKMTKETEAIYRSLV